MDAELKESVEEICRKMGMSLTMAFTDSVKEAAKAGNRMQKAGGLRMRIALS
jgi:antitoxin component of RelBE/YafQ-DinJ toxin-antitoxin module